jgi:hypothetical protein
VSVINRHGDNTSSGVPNGVAQGLPDDRLRVFDQKGRHHGVDGTVDSHGDARAPIPSPGGDVQQPAAQALPVAGSDGAQVERPAMPARRSRRPGTLPMRQRDLNRVDAGRSGLPRRWRRPVSGRSAPVPSRPRPGQGWDWASVFPKRRGGPLRRSRPWSMPRPPRGDHLGDRPVFRIGCQPWPPASSHPALRAATPTPRRRWSHRQCVPRSAPAPPSPCRRIAGAP